MRRFLLFILGVVFTTLLSAQPANVFFSTFDAERGNALAPARDGNLWLGGMANYQVLLTKLSLSGKVLEKHNIDFQGNGLDTDNLVEFFEDPDGTLVGCGNFENDNSGRAFVFRYNPATRTVLWAHIVRSGDLNYLFGIAPLGSGGGDYVLYGNPHFADRTDAELLRISRATGQIVPGKAKRFGIGRADNISQIVYHNGALYACGRFTNSNTGFDGDFARSRNALCKIDTATLQPVWTRIGPIPTTTFAQIYGRDLIIDNGAIISTYSGEANDPNLFASTVFLQKNDLAGNLLWAKQYDLPEWNGEFAEEVIALPDGYLLYGQDLLSDTSRLFLLKTDKQGNPVAAVKVDYDENDEFSEIPARSKILRIGDALFFTALSQNNLGQAQGILAKTDLNGWVSDSCGFFKKTAVNVVPMPAPVSEVVVPVVTASLATLTPAQTSTKSPDLSFSKKCGATGTCPNLPDLRFTLDSMPCRNGVPLLYFTVCNVGGQPYDGGVWIQIFDKNPLTDTARAITGSIGNTEQPILPGDCMSSAYSSELFPPNAFEFDTFPVLYGLMGANFLVQTPIPLSGFPYPPNEPECNYLNNLDSLMVPPQVCGDCQMPSTFVKKLGSPTERELAFSMCRSADGNVYIAGRQGDDPMIAKITPLGEPIWVRNFAGSSFFPTEIAEIIEDSDQKLMLCGTEGGSPSNRHAVAMRYDPVADQVLWSQQYPANRPVASGILEKSPGGNFLLSSNSQEFVGGALKTHSELLELDRATGAMLPALAVRYLGEPNLSITDMAMSNGSLYAMGGLQSGAQQSLLPMFAKISPTNGQPQWAFLTDPDSTATGQKLIGPGSMVIDGDIVFIAGNEGDPDGNGLLYLEKRRTDGSLTWIRRYDIQIFPQDVIRSENTIVVFGPLSYNSWGMVKVDLTTGDLIVAKTLDIALPSNNNTGFSYRKNLLIRVGLDLLMLDHTNDDMGGGDLLLLRTDTYFGLDDTCSLLRKADVKVVTRPAKSLPVTFQAVQTLTTAASWPQIFKSDSLAVSKLCPRCDCEGVPDVTFKVNRIACAADSSLEYRAEICNLGLAPLSGPFEVTFFDQNPLTQAAQAVWSTTVNVPLAPGQCKEITWPLPAAASQYPKLYTLAGVGSGAVTPVSISGFPYTQSGVEECRYSNNLDSFVMKTPVCDGCENPTTFFKTMGRADQSELGYSLCTASDGNVYMAGRQGDNPMVAKMTPNGEMLWVRNFSSDDGPFDDIDLVEIIEDSEGQLVLCGARNHSPNTRRAVVMRYDPVADQVLWFKQYAELYPEVLGIFEKTPGGNFVIYAFSDELFNSGGPIGGTYYRARSQVWELDRTTGEVVPGLSTLYPGNPSTSVYFQDIVQHQGSLYCVGGWDDDNIPNSGRAMLAKLSPFDGAPDWIQGTLPDTMEFRFISANNVLVDNDQLVVMGGGLSNFVLPNQKYLVFLSKYTLDGTLLWTKSYDAGIGAADIVALPDGYAIFGRTQDNAFGLIKVDKDGNLLKAQKIAPPATGPAYSFYRKHRLLRLPNHLLMVEDFKAGTYNDLMLLKTDYDLNLDDSCSLLQPLTVIVQARLGKTNPIITPFGPYNVTAVNKTTVFQADSLNVKQLCPQCPCVDKPDITCQVDSAYCTAADGPLVNLRICNLGQVSANAGFNLTFYDKNPLAGAAVPLYSTFVPVQPGFGDCVDYTLPLDTALQKYAKLYTLAGAWKDVQTPVSLDDFPLSNGFAECDYMNNLDSFELNLSTPVPLDLGPDRSICIGQTITLDAGSGYVTYQWLNGPATPTYMVSTAGNYIAEVTDECGNQQRDTVQITVLPYPKRTVSLVLLPGDSVVISGITYFGTATVLDTVPSLTGGCDTLTTYKLVLDSLGCKKPSSFLKTYEGSIGRVVLTASDSSVYVAGENVNSTTLSKYDAYGRHIWSRTLLSGGPLIYIASLTEDSEGMLAGSGSASGSAFAVVFRYNPATNQMLWRRQIAMDFFGLAEEFLEEKAGGDFLLVHSQSYLGSPTATEIQRLSRATGELLAGKAYRYEPTQILGAKMSGGMLYAVGEFKDSTASSASSSVAGLMKIDPTTGAIAWTRKVAGNNANGAFDLVVDAAGDAITLMGKYDEFWLQKTNPSGQLIWLRKYTPLNAADGSPYPRSIELSKDGNYIVSLTTSSVMSRGFVVVKIDKNGEVIWGRQVPDVDIPGNTRPQLLGTSNDDIFFTYGGYTLTSPLFGKFDRDGNLGDNCGAVKDFALKFSPLNLQLAPVAPKFLNRPRTNLTLSSAPPAPLNLVPLTRCAKCEVLCDSVAVTKTIKFYPGDTITIDGKAYTQSGTVVQNFTTAAGCDSVVTNILQLVITEVNITCPNNLTVTLPPNQTSTVVDYSLPTVTTNCPDSTIKLTLLQGLPVGGIFPEGTTQVCYEAANQCGIRDTCCFTITAQQPDLPCDVKTPAGCIRYDLLSIRLDSIGQRRYRVRMTNTCPSPLEFAYIQLPNGVLAVLPQQGATYTAPGGNTYAVRNPNASPFYSVRYKAVAGSLNNGKNDVFEYTLPQQSAPAYIHVAAKLADGTTSEAFLNTYNCPVLPYQGAENRGASGFPGSGLPGHLSVRPNPTSGVLFVDLGQWQGQQVHLRVLNAQGQLVLERDYAGESGEFGVDLPAGLASGLYYLVVNSDASGRRPSQAAAVRFVLER